MGRYPRRAIVISLLLPLLSTLVIGGIGTGILLAWHRHDTRATTVVTGRGDVISSGSGNETVRVDVWWKDATGDGREARFRVPAGREYEQSRPFAIRYDPADPDGVVFPADAAGAALIIPPAPPWWVLLPSVPFVLLTLGFGLGWLTRVRAARVAAAAPGTPYRVVPFVRWGLAGGLGSTREVPVGMGTLLLPVGAEVTFEGRRPPGGRWQNVMWNPVFARLSPGDLVTAHLGGGRAVLTTEHGTIWPAGPLWDKDFRTGQRITAAARTPVNARVAPGRTYLVAPLAGFVTVPILFAAPGVLLLVPFAVLLGYSVSIFLWAWRSGVPKDI